VQDQAEPEARPPSRADETGNAEDQRLDDVVRRRFPRLAALTLVSTFASGAVGFLAASWLGPSRYGEVQLVLIFYGVASVVQIGFFLGATRQAIHGRVLGDEPAAVKVQNVGTTFELLASVPPGLVIAAMALVVSAPVERVGFLLGAIAVPLASLTGFLGGLEIGYDRTERATLATALAGALSAALTAAGIKLIGAVAMFVGPMIGNCAAVALLTPRLWRLGLRPDFDRAMGRALAFAGFPLAVGTIAYWSYRWVGPTAVGIALGSTQLGYYSIAMAPVTVAIGALTVGARIFMPRFWQQIATVERARWVAEGDRTTTLFLLIGFVLVVAGQATFPWFIHQFLPHYGPSVVLFEILSLEIPLYLAGQAPSMVLDSVEINRPKRHLAVWVAALVANIGLDAVLLAFRLGAPAVAWADVGVQALVVLVLFAAARQFQGPLLARRRELGPGIAGMLCCLVVSGALMTQTFTAADDGGSVHQLGLRLLLLTVALALVGTVAVLGIPRSRPDANL
jgi:O-antigen/teichoic acid export membrane protein